MNSLPLCVAALLVAGTAFSRPQGPVEAADRTTSISRRAVGVRTIGQEVLAAGPDYQVRFHASGFTFQSPFLVDGAVPELRFRLLEARRRGADGHGITVPDVVPLSAPGTREVRYRRAGFVESYAVLPAGVEQRFEFAALPPGSGDLMVRGAIESDLPLAEVTSQRVRFAAGGVGGIAIEGVVGIDANGRRAYGAMTFHGGVLELSLPEAFVDRAALPLILDPLIGRSFVLPGGNDDEDPDVAYDASNDVYLVVWHRNPFGIRGQMVDSSGALRGSLLLIRISTAAAHPRVANVNYENRFAVVWEENDDILAATVDASSGGVAGPFTIAGTADAEISPDVGGEATTVDNEAIVVWCNSTQHRIQAAQFTASASPAVYGPVDVSGGSSAVWAPAISQSGGSSGHHLICWKADLMPFQSDIHAAVVDRNLRFLDSAVNVTHMSGVEQDPAVDGDGTRWVVAYEKLRTGGSSPQNDIACRGVWHSPAGGQAYLSPAEVVIERGNDDEVNPAVAWMGGSVLVGYADEYIAPDYDAYVWCLDPFDLASCEGRPALETGPSASDFVMIASAFSGGSSEHHALIVWESTMIATGDGNILAWFYGVEDGITEDLGGGCGSGGIATASCARIGNGGFDMRVFHASPSSAAYLVLGAERGDYPCNACTLVPELFSAFVFASGNTDIHGDAGLTTAIPSEASLVGVEFYVQWLVAGSGCLGADFSNALRVEIQ